MPPNNRQHVHLVIKCKASHDFDFALSVWVHVALSTLGHPISHHLLVKCIGVRVMDIVIDSSLHHETSRSPELTDVVCVVVPVEQVL